jgi:predicted esterase
MHLNLKIQEILMARQTRISNKPNEGRLYLESRTVFDYVESGPRNAQELVLLLHGFDESGSRMIEKLKPALPVDALIIAPNGPFPQVHRAETGYRLGYSWYLYDPATQEYFIDMSVALDFLDQGLSALGVGALSKTVIGFSQGGYLAPFAAHCLTNVGKVIGIGCEYLVDEWPRGIKFEIHGIHGANDDVVTAEEARRSFDRIRELQIKGTFQLLSESEHRIDLPVIDAVKGLFKNN